MDPASRPAGGSDAGEDTNSAAAAAGGAAAAPAASHAAPPSSAALLPSSEQQQQQQQQQQQSPRATVLPANLQQRATYQAFLQGRGATAATAGTPVVAVAAPTAPMLRAQHRQQQLQQQQQQNVTGAPAASSSSAPQHQQQQHQQQQQRAAWPKSGFVFGLPLAAASQLVARASLPNPLGAAAASELPPVQQPHLQQHQRQLNAPSASVPVPRASTASAASQPGTPSHQHHQQHHHHAPQQTAAAAALLPLEHAAGTRASDASSGGSISAPHAAATADGDDRPGVLAPLSRGELPPAPATAQQQHHHQQQHQQQAADALGSAPQLPPSSSSSGLGGVQRSGGGGGGAAPQQRPPADHGPFGETAAIDRSPRRDQQAAPAARQQQQQAQQAQQQQQQQPSGAKPAVAGAGARAPSLSPTSSLHSALSTLSGLGGALAASVSLTGMLPPAALASAAAGPSGADGGAPALRAASPTPGKAAARGKGAGAGSANDSGSADASHDAASSSQPHGSVWAPRLATIECRRPAPSTVPLATPTSSDYEYWRAHADDSMLFNVGLVAEPGAPRPVRLAAVDLARNSAWFHALLHARHELSGTAVTCVTIPCALDQGLLEAVVGALYASSIELGPDNVEAVYRAADAMEMPALMAACEAYMASTCVDDADADPRWVAAVFDLAGDLCRVRFASSLALHFATAAQRDAAAHRAVLGHVLTSPPYAGDARAQVALLRGGHEAAWNGQGPESLLINVMLEVAEALDAESLPAMLDAVDWGLLQQEEVAALVDWALAAPPEWPLTPLFKDRVLRAVSAQISGAHQRRFLVWRADVGRLPGAGQRLMSSGALTVGARRLYLCMERAGASEWGLFLCPPPDVALHSRVARHTLFALGPSWDRRVAACDVTISPDLRVGAGFGSRTIITELMAAGAYKGLADGSKYLTLGTIATHVPTSA